MSIASEITKLNNQRIALANNLTTKGVTASSSETLAQLVPKVLDIPTGGGGSVAYDEILCPIWSSYYSDGYWPTNVFDASTANYWSARGVIGQWIGIDFKKKATVNALYLTDANNRLKDFVFEGSDDGTTYTAILTTTRPNVTTETTHAISPSVSYRYFRVRCSGALYTGSNFTLTNMRMSYVY